MNIILPGESEAITRKISFLTIEENGPHQDNEGLHLITDRNKVADAIYTKFPVTEEEKPRI